MREKDIYQIDSDLPVSGTYPYFYDQIGISKTASYKEDNFQKTLKFDSKVDSLKGIGRVNFAKYSP
jgi:hypothetical protein